MEVGAFEAKTHLSQLLDQVGKGEQIIITRHGTPVAVLGPVAGVQKKDVPAVIAAIKEFRRGRRLAGLSVGELIEEGRR